jgi:hypothetical protein
LLQISLISDFKFSIPDFCILYFLTIFGLSAFPLLCQEYNTCQPPM